MMGKYPITNETDVDCPFRRVGMVGGTTQTLFLHEPVTNETCHSSPVFCTVCFPCLVSSPPGRYTAAFRDLPAIQYFSRSLLNDKYILETEMSFLCHNAKGNRNLQCASCKYTQCEEQF